MEEKKYEITEKFTFIQHKVVHRIRALKDFGPVKKGEYGGYVESEANLSQKGNCWIFDEAIAFENAKVEENAIISDDSVIRDNVKIKGHAGVQGRSRICGNIILKGYSTVNNARLDGEGTIANNIYISF